MSVVPEVREAITLEAQGLARHFGGLVAVDGVSLTLRRGELHAVIGPNGAGKSTLTNLLAGELAPSEGRLLLEGEDITSWPVWRRARAGIGRSFQRSNVMLPLTVAENLRLAVQAAVPTRRWWGRPQAAGREALERVGLAAQAGQLAGALSHGQMRLLEVAMVLAIEPRVLLLDEPMAGMGAEETEGLSALLADLAREHAMLLIEHDMDVVFALAQQVTVMVDGQVLARGTPAEIRASAAVRDAYLGHAA